MCRGGCHICPCKDEMLADALDILKTIMNGLENYRKTLPPHKAKELHAYVPCMESGKSVIRRIKNGSY